MNEWVEPDWKQVASDLRRFIVHRLQAKYRRPVEEELLADGAAIALAKLYRWWCRERERNRPIQSIEAMMNRVANFAAVDIIRLLIKGRSLTPVEEEQIPAPPTEAPFDAASRMRYVMLAFFQRQHATCYELAPPFFEDLRWQPVADQLGLTVDTVKKRWSRCVGYFEEFLGEHAEVEQWIFAEEA